MTPDPDRLYALLPAIHRSRDAELGGPLRALLQVIEEQRLVVEDDVWALYDAWFIETCPEWVVPYLGELVGLAGASGRERVADIVRRRRAKGTRAALEGAARDAAGWPVAASESYALLGVGQSLNHLRPDRRGIFDFGDPLALERIGGAFDRGPWHAAAPALDSRRSRSRWALPGVALFAWRLKAQPLTEVPAFSLDRARHHYRFSVLGNDTPLFSPAAGPDSDASPLDESDVPQPIGLRAFADRLPSFYGPGRSLRIFVGPERTPVPVHAIVAADLASWSYRPPSGYVAVDPVNGRIAFAAREAPQEGVWVTFHHGTVDDLGGGEYRRGVQAVGTRAVYRVGRGEDHARIAAALAAWEADRDADAARADAVIEITDGEAYTEPLEVRLRPGDRLELRAAEGVRPVVRLLDYFSNRPDYLRVIGEDDGGPPATGPCPVAAPRLVLDGLLMTGRGVEVTGTVGDIVVRHCTLVPGWAIDEQCRPQYEEEPSLALRSAGARLAVEHSIVGTIIVDVDPGGDPAPVTVADSIVDAAAGGANALCAPDDRHAYAALDLRRVTVFGGVLAHSIRFAEDVIFMGDVHVVRRQEGCVRYSYIRPGCRTPRRYRCQPELAVAAVREEARAAALTGPGLDELLLAEERRVRPRFDSVRYGTPPYGRLAAVSPPEITRGAHDESEMGVYHDLFHPQRADSLRAVLDDFTPAGMAAGTFFAT